MQNTGEISDVFRSRGAGTAQLGNFIDVRSYVFQVKVEAEISDYKRNFYGILSRGGDGGQTDELRKILLGLKLLGGGTAFAFRRTPRRDLERLARALWITPVLAALSSVELSVR